jgi:hypothetical protein
MTQTMYAHVNKRIIKKETIPEYAKILFLLRKLN